MMSSTSKFTNHTCNNNLNHVLLGTYNPEIRQIIYLQNRQYLPPSSELRIETHGFPSQQVEMKRAPDKRTMTDVKNNHKAVDNAT